MRRLTTASLSLLLLGLAASAGAQAPTTVSVDISKAKLSWSWTQGTGGAATEFRVKCGTATGVYTLPVVHVIVPATTVAVLSVVTTPGTYFCVVTAANAFGESGPSNEVPFAAGVVPVAPTSLLLLAQ